MMITAHGGALGTGRNTPLYFKSMEDYLVDAIEIDLRKKNGKIYLAHSPFYLFNPKKLTLKRAFEFVKKNGWTVNCDVKRSGLVKEVLSEAKNMGIEDNILFTGSVSEADLRDLDAGCVYLNATFFPYKMTEENVPQIKKHIEKFKNPRIKGININFRCVTDGFASACERENLKISVYTVDEPELIKRLVAYSAVVNVTTNIPDKGLEILGRGVKK